MKRYFIPHKSKTNLENCTRFATGHKAAATKVYDIRITQAASAPKIIYRSFPPRTFPYTFATARKCFYLPKKCKHDGRDSFVPK